MVSGTLFVLAELHYHYGFIGLDEFIERCSIADWLEIDAGSDDPRQPGVSEELREETTPEGDGEKGRQTAADTSRPDDSSIEFLWSGWLFTRQDPDPYPSTPHGHLGKSNRAWPKLNPYTGRVFKQKHQEDLSLRLTKKQMILLWSDQRFRDFCRSHVVWYAETFPRHAFGVSHPLRFPRPWR